MIQFRKYILIGLLFSLSFSAMASSPQQDFEKTRDAQPQGVSSVGQGGGYAELTALRVHGLLPGFDTRFKPQVQLLVSSSCRRLPIAIIEKDRIEISACALYQVNDRHETLPKDTIEIIRWVITANLMLQLNDLDTAYAKAAGIAEAFDFSEDVSTFILDYKTYLLHQSSLRKLNQSRMLVSVDSNDQTIELSSVFEKQFSCGQEHESINWVIDNPFYIIENEKKIVIEWSANWHCDSRQNRGRLRAILISENDQLKVIKVSLLSRNLQLEN